MLRLFLENVETNKKVHTRQQIGLPQYKLDLQHCSSIAFEIIDKAFSITQT